MNMILAPRDNYNNFTSHDIFHWSLSIVTILKYYRAPVSVLNLKSHLTKLLKSCQWHQVNLIAFLTNLDKLFSEFFESNEIYN